MMADVSDLSASHSYDKSKKLMEKSIINAIERIRMKQTESGDILRNRLRKEDCENRQCENEFYAKKYMNSLEQEVRFLKEE